MVRSSHSFPPPWTIEELKDAHIVVKDNVEKLVTPELRLEGDGNACEGI
jgi:hypothetical protein